MAITHHIHLFKIFFFFFFVFFFSSSTIQVRHLADAKAYKEWQGKVKQYQYACKLHESNEEHINYYAMKLMKEFASLTLDWSKKRQQQLDQQNKKKKSHEYAIDSD
jgi:hypothetical protein